MAENFRYHDWARVRRLFVRAAQLWWSYFVEFMCVYAPYLRPERRE